MQGQKSSLYQTIRAVEWWEYKLSPIFATLYATAFLLNLSVFSLWPVLIVVLVALIPGAAYVSVINDLTDLKDDLASGKNNRLVGRSRLFIGLTLACCVLPGVLVALYLRNDTLLLALYLANWAAFSLYSLPPVRLKNRGLPGILADAAGAHVLPTLFVVTLVFRRTTIPIHHLWFGSVAVWSLGYGLRGILWHQFSDLDNDEKAQLRTFVLRHKLSTLHRLGTFVVFPAELMAFAVMLWLAGSRISAGLLFFHVLLQWARKRRWKTNMVIVAPKTRYLIVMQEYYEVFYPIAFLLSSSLSYPRDAFVLVLHLMLFPRRAAQTVTDVSKLIKER
jgi:4-hydroxybenzoate polyprenyltransferase